MNTRRRSLTPEGFHHGDNPIPAACVVGNLLFSGGVNPVDYATGDVPDDIVSQTARVFENVSLILREAGASFDDVAKIEVSSDPQHRGVVNAAWLIHFPDEASRPARKMTARTLPAGFLIQCEFIAVVPDHVAAGTEHP